MTTYYGRFKGHKMYHIIHADSVSLAREKMLKGTKYKANEIIIKVNKPKTKYPIAGK